MVNICMKANFNVTTCSGIPTGIFSSHHNVTQASIWLKIESVSD